MKLLRILYPILVVAVIFGLSNGIVWATPSAQVLYSETPLGGGLWEYDYTFYNTSDPIADAGYDLYDLFLNVSPAVTLSNILSATNWDFISDSSTFIDWSSTMPGEPPIGSDIAPGTSLSGFSLTSDTQLASLSFDATLSNPNDPINPVVFPGTTALVPEPSTLILVGSGLIGLTGYGRKKFCKK